MLQTLKKYLSNFILTVVALQVLNLGLYAQDFEATPASATTEQNIINSVTEYVAEIILDKKNAFPEKEELPNQSHETHDQLVKLQPFKIINSQYTQHQFFTALSTVNYNCFLISTYANFKKDIIAPPPKA